MKTALNAFAALAAVAVATTAAANEIRFDDRWVHQPFSMFSNNDYEFAGDRLEVTSDDAVSLVYTQLPRDFWGARRAAWSWAVEESAPATDLAKKGGDDRNLSIYAVFLPPDDAETMAGESVVELLEAENARVLTYIWGGRYERGALVPSPYMGESGVAIMLREAGPGGFAEEVDLGADLARAFGAGDMALVGLAVSADSDDTDSRIRASVSSFVLR